jgi:hypothetical protein
MGKPAPLFTALLCSAAQIAFPQIRWMQTQSSEAKWTVLLRQGKRILFGIGQKEKYKIEIKFK